MWAPKVEFFGGGGRGVTGSAIVNTIGRVIGVSIGGAGSGFTSPPLLSFVDSCGNGSSAGGYPRIKDGKVVDVVITDQDQVSYQIQLKQTLMEL